MRLELGRQGKTGLRESSRTKEETVWDKNKLEEIKGWVLTNVGKKMRFIGRGSTLVELGSTAAV